MRPTILLTGKTGQVGFELSRLLPKYGQLVSPGRDDLDVGKPHDLRRLIRETRPQIIVNAAAYTAVDMAENDESRAYALNAEAPGVLAVEAKRTGAVLVHYSTDYVFDGSKQAPYDETDPPNPLNVYGKTKLAGECAIRDSGVFHLILRTSWVYSTRGKNFLLTILRLATEREELKVVSDQVGAPTCAWDIAVATTQVLAGILRPDHAGLVDSFSSVTGTYHMTASGETTWYEFVRVILAKAVTIPHGASWFARATNDRPIVANRVLPITTEEFASPTRRPRYSVLSNTRLAQTFHVSLPDWLSQLESCLMTGSARVVHPGGSVSSQTG